MKRSLLHSCLLVGISLFPIVLISQSLNSVFVTGPTMSIARMAQQAVVLPNQKVLLIGGHGTNFVSLNNSDLLSIAPDGFALQSMSGYRDGGAVEQMQDGRLLIAGGAADLGVAPGYNTAEVYNPATNKFSATGTLTYGRMESTAATMQNGKVLVVGGWYNANSTTYGEVYDPSAGTFTPTKALQIPRANPVVVPTSDGGALVFSGYGAYGGSTFESVEYYNPTTNSFSLLRSRLTNASVDSGWVPFVYSAYNRLVGTHRTRDGKYMFLSSRTFGDSSMCSLFSVDPVTKTFALFPTKTKLPSSKSYSFLTIIVDSAKSVVYLPAQLVNSDPVKLAIFAVSLIDGSIVKSPTDYTLPTKYYQSGTSFVLLADGRLLMSGGHNQTGYNTNFSPVQTTFFITPNYTQPLTSVQSDAALVPGTVSLAQNYPNPFNPSTTISFSLPSKAFVSLKIFDVMGREVATLASEDMPTGKYSRTWNASEMPSGMYFYRLQVGSFTETKKLLLIR